MKKKRKALVKVYNWKMLTRLAIEDMRKQHGIDGPLGDIHYIGGLDHANKPFIRVDLMPLDTEAKNC